MSCFPGFDQCRHTIKAWRAADRGWDDRTLRRVFSGGGDSTRFWERTLEPVYHSRGGDGVPMYTWFSGGLTNAAFNEVDRYGFRGIGEFFNYLKFKYIRHLRRIHRNFATLKFLF